MVRHDDVTNHTHFVSAGQYIQLTQYDSFTTVSTQKGEPMIARKSNEKRVPFDIEALALGPPPLSRFAHGRSILPLCAPCTSHAAAGVACRSATPIAYGRYRGHL